MSRYALAFAAVGGVRLALWFMPFARVAAACARVHDVAAPPARRATIDGVVVAVHHAARLVPRATCLTQALAAQRLLGRTGIPATLRFGAARSGARIHAHAWLDVDGQRVIGDVPASFTPLDTRGTRHVG